MKGFPLVSALILLVAGCNRPAAEPQRPVSPVAWTASPGYQEAIASDPIDFDLDGNWQVSYIKDSGRLDSVCWTFWRLQGQAGGWRDEHGLGQLHLHGRHPQFLTWDSPTGPLVFAVVRHETGVLTLVTPGGSRYRAVRTPAGATPPVTRGAKSK